MQFSVSRSVICTLFPLFTFTLKISGQQKNLVFKVVKPDTNQRATDTDVFIKHVPIPQKEKLYHPDSTHSPAKAILKSAIVPGLGQVYNNNIWKVPLIYGALSSLTVTAIYNNRNYQRYLRLYHYYNDISKITIKTRDYVYFEKLLKDNISQAEVAGAADDSQRYFQLSILGLAAVWGIQMIDAYIDAKFAHSFSMDNNLSIKISPSLTTQPVYAANFGAAFIPVVKITLAF
ncbi:hypothetical protein JN11_01631 [Mucilaginibacter frigoritolerans]|uniref:DUF5683 domain-containing protein n=1 Tax=Mucilaginibacter frigoritolerans TaxID=652788 RepID=A0A562U6P5_9SPHI|nr:DUF5683 domain-containing protein [Mucilaginibacter frigoritolerans]TWJ01480.1 hypothetical protein JN11_01631 [Mucilaginibacter frigoritolerans]